MSLDFYDTSKATRLLLAQLGGAEDPVETVTVLINAGADINSVLWDLLGDSNKDPIESIKLLAQAGVDVSRIHSYSTLHRAAEKGHCQVVQYLLNQYPVLRDDPGCYGETPLIAAIIHSSLPVVKVLLDAGADCRIKDKRGDPVLCIAAKWCKAEIVRELVERGDCMYEQNNEGNTALHHCAKHGSWRVVSAMIEGGMDVNTLNRDGSTSLWLALHHGRLRMAEWLLENGANPTIDKGDRNSISYAKRENLWPVLRKIVAWLRKNNEDPNEYGLDESYDEKPRICKRMPRRQSSTIGN